MPNKKQKTVSIPLQFYEEVADIWEESKEDCLLLEISSPSELLRVLAKLGKPRFLQILEQVRITGKANSQNPK